MRTLPRLSLGAAVVISGVVVRSVAAFALTKFAALFLGPVEFAKYGHYLMLASYLVTASNFGLTNAFTVYLVRRSQAAAAAPEREGDASSVVLLGTATGLLAAVALLVAELAGLGGAFLPRITPGQSPLWVLFCVGAGGGSAYLASLLAQQRHLAYQSISAAVPLLSCLLLVGIARWTRPSADSAMACYLAGMALPLTAYALRGPPFRLASKRSMVELVRFASPYVLPGLLAPTVATVGILTVRRVLSASVASYDLGLWQALWRVGEAYMSILISILSALFIPRVSRARTRPEAVRLVSRAIIASIGLYAPVALVWALLPRFTLGILLSDAFVGIQPLLPMQVAGDVLKVVCTVLILTCTALLRPQYALVAEAAFTVSFITSASLLAPRTGAWGAVTAYACAYGALTLLMIPLIKRALGGLPVREPVDVPGAGG